MIFVTFQLLRIEQHHLKFRIVTFHHETIVREGYLPFPIICVLGKDGDKITGQRVKTKSG